MSTKEERKRIEVQLSRMLHGGETLTLSVAQELFGDFDPGTATKSYLMGKLRTWVHKIADKENAMAMSVGPGQGYKFVQTLDEQLRVFSFALSRLRGERSRMDRAKVVMDRLKASGQLTIEVWEQMEGARLAALAERPVTSASVTEEKTSVAVMKGAI